MLETIAIISNGIVVVAIGALYRKINKQEESLNNHIVNFTKEITGRPGFDQLDKEIEKAEQRQCTKIKTVQECCDNVKEQLFKHLLESK